MKNYSFANYRAYVDGTEIVGFATDGDVITAARNVDQGQMTITADGTGVWSESTNRSGLITFNLSQTSTSNALLSGLQQAQQNGATTPIAVMLKDLDGNDVCIGTRCKITRPADLSRGVTAATQTWVFHVEVLEFLYSGSSDV